MDEKGRALQGRLDFCERNVKALETGVNGLIKNHQGPSIPHAFRLIESIMNVSCLSLPDSSSIPDGCQSTLELSQRVRDTAAQVCVLIAWIDQNHQSDLLTVFIQQPNPNKRSSSSTCRRT